MLARSRSRAVPLALSALAFALAILQRPGWSSSDTKIDLHTDPVRFLGEITSLWTPSSGLGGVESAQYAGYLFPMGPFFVVGHALGLSDWLVDRLWLGLLLAVGCWGMVRLAEDLGAARTSMGSLVAGLAYLLNPYVVVFANRTSITLLAYALLPWLVLVARRGLYEARHWRRPALFALLVTASGGGVNAAVVALALLAPLALGLYEPLTRAVPWRAAWQFGWRALAATFVASLWWIAPAAAQAAYGVDFLRFTEPAGAIWATTSLSESFRAMGYWISYIGVGFHGVVRPYFSDAHSLLFNHALVSASLLVPGLALFGFAWTRRRRYAAYFLLLVLLATLVMAIGFPEGTPLRRGATFAYNHFASLRFLRTTYKAGPLVVLGVAGLSAMAIEFAAARMGNRARPVLVVAAAALLALSAWPLATGDAVDKQVSWKHIPAGWKAAAGDLDRSLGNNARAAVLPGQLYAFYNWGGTVDPILPSLTKKPVAVRNAVPYGDLRGTDLLWTTDALVQQGRLVPGQLQPLLALMSVRDVVSSTDDDVHRSGVSDPRAAARALAAQGLTGTRDYGSGVRGYGVERPRPLVRVERRGPLAVVDGGADGLADLAGVGELPTRDPFGYAGDLSGGAIRGAAADGGTVFITDSNRRRVFVVSRMRQNTSATLPAGESISEDAATLNPFPERGSDGQTVAVLHGARSINAPFSPGYSQFPEHRPLAAFDGNPRTAWFGDRALDPDRQALTVVFDKPRDVGAISVLPRDEAGARTIALVINGKRYPLHSGWNRLSLDLKQAAALHIKVVGAKTGSASGGGLAEVRVPGLHVTESLRPPVLAEKALSGKDLRRTTLVYSFSRATGDNPFKRRDPAGVRVSRYISDPAALEQRRVDGAGDEETGIDRVIAPPAARVYDVSGWASTAPGAAVPRSGCGTLVLVGGERPVPLRIVGRARPGAPLRLRGCAKLRMRAGTQRLRVEPRGGLRPDRLLLTSPAPRPVAQPAGLPGAVLDSGDPGRGSRDNVKLDTHAPAWLVLGESYDKGWRAWCDGKSLGQSVPLDGYANAWPIGPGCKTARFAFAPQKPVRWIQILSALACLVLLAIALGVGSRHHKLAYARSRWAPRDPHDADVAFAGGTPAAAAALASSSAWLADDPPARMSLGRAAVIGLVTGGILAFCFSLRSGLLIAPATALVLWRGIPAKPLAIAGGALLAIAVPLDYILFPAPDFGGYNPGYAGDQISGHWLAVAAWVLLALALARTLSTASRARGAPSAAPPDTAE